MGLTLGIVAAPCIDPFVLGLLTWVAGTANLWAGFLVFFTLSLGLGLPLFILALFSGHIEKLPRSGEWMLWVRKLMGWVLIGMAAYFIRPALPLGSGRYLLAVVSIAAGLHLGWLDKTGPGSNLFLWIKTAIATLCLVLATITVLTALMTGTGVKWHSYSDKLMNEAASEAKAVVIDFYADWCAPCRELEENTFHNPDIVKLSKNDVVMIQIDLTRKASASHERLLKRYGIKGVPTVVFIDAGGNERKDLRLVDYVSPDHMLVKIARLRHNS